MRAGLLMLLQLMKKIEEVVDSRDMGMMMDLMIKFISLNLSQKIKIIYNKAKSGKNKADEFVLGALQTMFFSLTHHPTIQRLTLIRFCQNFLRTKSLMKENELQQLNYLIWEFELIIGYKNFMKQALDTSFCFWLRNDLENWLGHLSNSEGEYFRLQLFINSICDSVSILKKAIHLEDPKILVESYKTYICKLIHDVNYFLKRNL